MKWLRAAVWLLPVILAAVFWWLPPRGDDAYYHSVGAVEQVRAWQEGAVFPGYHRGWNSGAGLFALTICVPVSMAVHSGLAWLVGGGQRVVGLFLSLTLLAVAAFSCLAIEKGGMVLLVETPYVLGSAMTRATPTDAWAAGRRGMRRRVVTSPRALGLVFP
ncbi:MAG: hypothetical protein QNL88_17835 [Acidobacteriota bacterium]|nr:hypothetical protein [Acidobacteriota bacterium]